MLAPSRKERPSFEFACELVFRPLAHLVVLALLPLRVPPPAVVLAATTVGFGAAIELWHGNLIAAALLLQLKTVLDNADGQLARASGRVSVLGRYLDSESDLLINAAVFVALGHVTGRPWLAAVAFVVLTLVLSVDFNLERLYRAAPPSAEPRPTGITALLAWLYAVLYGWHDRLIEGFVESRLHRLPAEARTAYHDRATLRILANFGLSTQLAVLGICLAAGSPTTYLLLVLACGLTLVPLALRRERLAHTSSPVP